MTLRTKLTSLVALNTLVVLALFVLSALVVIRRAAFEETGERALAVARQVASLPAVVEAFGRPDPAATIQPLAETIRKSTQAEFIVVGNMQLIRYSHTNPAEIGKHMVGEDDEAVLHGRESVTQAAGTMGLSVRGKAPVFDRAHRQVGVVSTGFLVQGIELRVRRLVLGVAMACAVALLLGLVGAHLLSGHFKAQILGMEPQEIAFATRQQAAILEAIHEGVLAVDAQARVVTCNREAKKILRVGDDEVVGRPITDVLPVSRLPEVLATGVPQYGQPLVAGEALLQTNRVPVHLEGRVIGAVATFREKLELEEIESRLADVGRYVEDLRSQRHEFMNRLHLILGLIHASDYAGAQAVIERVNDEYQRALDFYLARIRDPAVVGILVGKTHQARELGIDLVVTPDSLLSRPCPHRDAVVTILGNAVANAIEALQAMGAAAPARREVRVSVREEPERLLVEVSDNGPGVAPADRARLFDAGVTTKGAGRGLGLAIVARLVGAAGGAVAFEDAAQGARLRVTLPREGAA
ncbi:MAG TPA: sensor histidine kinase [Anaeromyxobacteraceae bacterium]|nr:sensor histidine kinase [Anaeromyxobacteraceae bacterium]